MDWKWSSFVYFRSTRATHATDAFGPRSHPQQAEASPEGLIATCTHSQYTMILVSNIISI